MEKSRLQFTIVTPESTIFDGSVGQVSIMTAAGEITVLPHHIPLLGILTPGELKIQDDSGEELHIAVAGGFVEVAADNHVTVLADAAERADEIDLERAQQAQERARIALEKKQFANDIEFAALQAALERSLSRIKVARKRRRK